MLETNVNGLIYVTKAALPLIRKARAPYIVNVGSIAGRENYLGGNIYSASKAAVKSLTASLRLELASEGIRVGEIAPGAAETEFSLVRFEGDESKAAGVYTGFTPLHAIDIASALYYMCTLPEHVCIPEMVIMPTVQPNANTIYKK
jgi:NADP-dependent 3-hydroxy acid dehydrogenase YdfG